MKPAVTGASGGDCHEYRAEDRPGARFRPHQRPPQVVLNELSGPLRALYRFCTYECLQKEAPCRRDNIAGLAFDRHARVIERGNHFSSCKPSSRRAANLGTRDHLTERPAKLLWGMQFALAHIAGIINSMTYNFMTYVARSSMGARNASYLRG